MKLKTLSALFCTVGCIIAGAHEMTSVEVNVVELKKIKPHDMYYTGKVEAIEEGIVTFGMVDGVIKYTKRVGDTFIGPTYNADGSLNTPGEMLVCLENNDQYGMVKCRENSLAVARQEYEREKNAFERAEKLVKSHAISQESYEKAWTSYKNAEIKVQDLSGAVLTANYDLEKTQIMAPYSGIVLSVMKRVGMGADKKEKVMRIAQISPVRVRLPFAPEISTIIGKYNYDVYVYPTDGSAPVKGWLRMNPMDTSSLYVYLPNDVTSQSSENKYHKAYMLSPVVNFWWTKCLYPIEIRAKLYNTHENVLGVFQKALKKDVKGTYVVKAKAYYEGDSKLISTNIFTAEKVYVKVGNAVKDIALGASESQPICALEDCGSLKSGDAILMLHDNENINNGDIVALTGEQWKFKFNEEVKVAIPALIPEGFYVPVESIIHESSFANYVFVVNNENKIEIVEVEIVGHADKYYAITGKGISDGTKVVLLKNKEDAFNFYDGLPVVAVKIDGPIFYNRAEAKHVDPLIPYEALNTSMFK